MANKYSEVISLWVRKDCLKYLKALSHFNHKTVSKIVNDMLMGYMNLFPLITEISKYQANKSVKELNK